MILLTGFKGFIGRNIAEKIKVLTPDLDILDYYSLNKFVRENRVRTVIHCAIKEVTRRNENLYCNTTMLLNILRLPVKYIVLFGSGSQFNDYPKRPEYKLFKEIQAKLIKHDRRVVNLILYGVYGKYDDIKNKFIPNSIIRSLNKKTIIVNQNREMSYLYVGDLVRIIKYFLHKKKYGSYGIVPPKSIKLSEIAKLLGFYRIKNKTLAPKYIGSCEKIKKELPHFKFISFQKGLRLTVKHFKKNIYA